MLASLWNEPIMRPKHQTLQDTNDRFLANMQRGGLYSVIPRVPGGEISPDKLIALGETAKKFGLYTKITGGQRIDLGLRSRISRISGRNWSTLALKVAMPMARPYGRSRAVSGPRGAATACRIPSALPSA